MRINLSRGSDGLETLVITADSSRELAIILDGDGPRAVVERGVDLGPCLSVDRSPSRGDVRSRVAAWGRAQCACSGTQEPQ